MRDSRPPHHLGLWSNKDRKEETPPPRGDPHVAPAPSPTGLLLGEHEDTFGMTGIGEFANIVACGSRCFLDDHFGADPEAAEPVLQIDGIQWGRPVTFHRQTLEINPELSPNG